MAASALAFSRSDSGGDGGETDDVDHHDDGGQVDVDAEVESLLTDIYLTQLRTNIVSVVMVGLLVLLIILVLALLVWAYLFVDQLEPKANQPAFYRRLSRPTNNRQPILNAANNGGATAATAAAAGVAAGAAATTAGKESTYGSTNQAFDPTPDTDPVFETEGREVSGADADGADGPDPAGSRATGRSTFFGDTLSSQDSVATEPSDEAISEAEKAKRSKRRNFN